MAQGARTAAGVERVRTELLDAFGYFHTESSHHASEYVPYFLRRGRRPQYPDRVVTAERAGLAEVHGPLDDRGQTGRDARGDGAVRDQVVDRDQHGAGRTDRDVASDDLAVRQLEVEVGVQRGRVGVQDRDQLVERWRRRALRQVPGRAQRRRPLRRGRAARLAAEEQRLLGHDRLTRLDDDAEAVAAERLVEEQALAAGWGDGQRQRRPVAGLLQERDGHGRRRVAGVLQQQPGVRTGLRVAVREVPTRARRVDAGDAGRGVAGEAVHRA